MVCRGSIFVFWMFQLSSKLPHHFQRESARISATVSDSPIVSDRHAGGHLHNLCDQRLSAVATLQQMMLDVDVIPHFTEPLQSP